MMQRWTKVLPFFVVARIARRHCERFEQGQIPWPVVMPFPGVLLASTHPATSARREPTDV